MWCKVSCGWVQLRTEKRRRYHPERHMVKQQVLSYGLLLNRREYQDEFLKKVILVTSLDTLNHAITDTVLGKEGSLGLLQPSWKIMETPSKHCESQSTPCNG